MDGFPRNFDNLEGWERVVGESAVVDGVLQYEVPEDTMVARLLERGKSSGRSDDNEASMGAATCETAVKLLGAGASVKGACVNGDTGPTVMAIVGDGVLTGGVVHVGSGVTSGVGVVDGVAVIGGNDVCPTTDSVGSGA